MMCAWYSGFVSGLALILALVLLVTYLDSS